MKTNHQRGYVAGTVNRNGIVPQGVKRESNRQIRRASNKIILDEIKEYNTDPLIEMFMRIHQDWVNNGKNDGYRIHGIVPPLGIVQFQNKLPTRNNP